jgi:hypothetical protein
MALVITTQTLLDTPTETHLKLDLGGTSGDVTDVAIFDPANFLNPSKSNKLMYIKGAICGFFIILNWEGVANATLLKFGVSSNFYAHVIDHTFNGCDCDGFGGILNNATTPTGKILLTSSGYGGVPTEYGWLIMGIRKREYQITR